MRGQDTNFPHSQHRVHRYAWVCDYPPKRAPSALNASRVPIPCEVGAVCVLPSGHLWQGETRRQGLTGVSAAGTQSRILYHFFDFPILQNYGRCVDKTYMPLLIPALAYSELMRLSRPLFMTFLEKKIRHECSLVSPLNRPSAVW
jgi:hypothetical protein